MTLKDIFKHLEIKFLEQQLCDNPNRGLESEEACGKCPNCIEAYIINALLSTDLPIEFMSKGKLWDFLNNWDKQDTDVATDNSLLASAISKLAIPKKESIVKKVLEILHKDGIIDCNEYQGKDFADLIKRLEEL